MKIKKILYRLSQIALYLSGLLIIAGCVCLFMLTIRNRDTFIYSLCIAWFIILFSRIFIKGIKNIKEQENIETMEKVINDIPTQTISEAIILIAIGVVMIISTSFVMFWGLHDNEAMSWDKASFAIFGSAVIMFNISLFFSTACKKIVKRKI